MSWLDRALGAALAGAVLASLAWLSNAPLTAHRSSDAVLRLAWSARPERVETCREQSSEELARLPSHMRQPLICEGSTAEYRLVVRDDRGVIADRIVRGGGLRQDRRLYVFEEVPLAAGQRGIEIRFDRLGSAAGDEQPGGSSPAKPSGDRVPEVAAGAIPPELSLTIQVAAAPREVVLVTYDPDRRALTAVQPSRP